MLEKLEGGGLGAAGKKTADKSGDAPQPGRPYPV